MRNEKFHLFTTRELLKFLPDESFPEQTQEGFISILGEDAKWTAWQILQTSLVPDHLKLILVPPMLPEVLQLEFHQKTYPQTLRVIQDPRILMEWHENQLLQLLVEIAGTSMGVPEEFLLNS